MRSACRSGTTAIKLFLLAVELHNTLLLMNVLRCRPVIDLVSIKVNTAFFSWNIVFGPQQRALLRTEKIDATHPARSGVEQVPGVDQLSATFCQFFAWIGPDFSCVILHYITFHLAFCQHLGQIVFFLVVEKKIASPVQTQNLLRSRSFYCHCCMN